MIDYKISTGAKEAIKNKIPMVFRIVTDYNIMDRIITPIGTSDDLEQIVIYSHFKKTYVGAAKEGIQVWTVCESKEMPNPSTINSSIYLLIETLERSGYVFHTEK